MGIRVLFPRALAEGAVVIGEEAVDGPLADFVEGAIGCFGRSKIEVGVSEGGMNLGCAEKRSGFGDNGFDRGIFYIGRTAGELPEILRVGGELCGFGVSA